MERFLFRISKSKYAQTVILKGALLLKTIGIPNARPTLDIDMLRKGKTDQASLLALIKDCAMLEVEEDGVSFLANTANAEEITKDSKYQGTRVLMEARMDNVRLKIQADFGVGDVVVPGPRMIEYPVLLGNDSIELLAYPVETAIAEKLQAMIALAITNSRMKDFYDVWICLAHLDFNAKTLLDAITATFENRQTPIPAEAPQAFSAEFVRTHRVQWSAFVKKIGEEHVTDAFGKVIEDLSTFAMPAFGGLASGTKLTRQWKAESGWVAS
jgi:Nucleotidyl transferase AbiEii toxin, Type IV TA system